MNKKRLKELIKVNLRYANPQQTTQQRDKGKSGKRLTRSLYRQYIYSGLIFLLIYGVVLIFFDFSAMPGTFTYYVALFGVIAFSQGISAIYNVFFESADLPNFLPLPFFQAEVFISKIMVVVLAMLPLVLPVLLVFILTALRAKVFPPLAIVLGLVAFGLFLSIIFSLCSFIVFGLTKTQLFKKHRQLVTSLLLIIAAGTAVIGVMTMNQQADATASGNDRRPIVFLLTFFYSLTQPEQINGWLSWIGLLILTVFLLVIFSKLFLPKLTEQLLASTQTVKKTTKKRRKKQNLHQLLRHYNTQLINNASLLMQMFSNSVMLPVIFTLSFGVSGNYDFNQLSLNFLGVTFLGGVALATITTNQTSLVANAISLDQQNFLFVRSLPLLLGEYLKEKFLFVIQIQGTLIVLITIIIGTVFSFPVVHIFSLSLGGLLGTYLASLYYFNRDYRLLCLDWTEVSQLFSRGAGNLGLVFNMFGSVLVSALILTFYTLGVYFAPLITNGVASVIVVLIVGVWLLHYKSVWEKVWI